MMYLGGNKMQYIFPIMRAKNNEEECDGYSEDGREWC
jgi:hypothetical protein